SRSGSRGERRRRSPPASTAGARREAWTSDPTHGGASEEPVGAEDEHRDDDREADRELKVSPDAGQVGAREVDRDADDQPADDRAEGTLDAAEDRRGEGVDDDRLHHVRL